MEISIKWSMCRTCMDKQCTTLRPLLKSRAAEHLNQYAGLAVAQDDGLPDQICADCADKLEQFHRFMGMCRLSDKHLKNLVCRTMSSSASFTGGSPPNQKKRARKQEFSAQKRGVFSDDETSEELLERNVKIEDRVEKSESQDFVLLEEQEHWIVFDDDEYVNPEKKIFGNVFETTSSQGSPIAIHNGVDSQEESEADSFVQKPDNAPEDQHKGEIRTKQYTTTSNLKSHMRKNLGERTYECEFCSKRFNAVCNLTSHMRTHTGEKPFQCVYCARRFSDHSSLRKHERIHTNERPYACKICGKAFSLSTSRKAHYMTHSSIKPYKCEPCTKSFRLKHQLTAHEKTDAHRMVCAGLPHMN